MRPIGVERRTADRDYDGLAFWSKEYRYLDDMYVHIPNHKRPSILSAPVPSRLPIPPSHSHSPSPCTQPSTLLPPRPHCRRNRHQHHQPSPHHPHDHPIPRPPKTPHIRLRIIHMRESPLRSLHPQKPTQRAPPLLDIKLQQLPLRHHLPHPFVVLQKRPRHVHVPEVAPAPALQHGLLVRPPGRHEGAVQVAQDPPGAPAHDGEDGGVHGRQPGVDGPVGQDEFGSGIGGYELRDHAGGGEVEDGLCFQRLENRLLLRAMLGSGWLNEWGCFGACAEELREVESEVSNIHRNPPTWHPAPAAPTSHPHPWTSLASPPSTVSGFGPDLPTCRYRGRGGSAGFAARWRGLWGGWWVRLMSGVGEVEREGGGFCRVGREGDKGTYTWCRCG